jgi:hypothetical protein
MHPLQSLLNRRARSQSQTINAVIDSAVGDGTGDYYVVRADSGQRVRASVSASGVTFAKRTPVLLLRPDDGTIASRSAYIILENRTFTAKGTAFAPPVIDADHLAGAAVVMLSPSPFSIARGSTATLSIYGAGLFGPNGIIDYDGTVLLFLAVTPSGSTLSIPAVISAGAGLVQLTVSALSGGGGGVAGRYDLTVGDITYLDFFTVTA